MKWCLLLVTGALLCGPGCQGFQRCSFSEVMDAHGRDRSRLVIKLTPIQIEPPDLAVGRELPSLLLVGPESELTFSDLRRMGRHGLQYDHDLLYLREIPFSTGAFQHFLEAIEEDHRFTNGTPFEESVLSMIIAKKLEKEVIVAEAFIFPGDFSAFAERLTNAALGTDAFGTLLQWEMNTF